MGLSLPAGGGRGRGVVANVSLVPFIDLLTSLITFLMLTAVWVQAQALEQDLAAGEGSAERLETAPPLRVHLRLDGAWVGRGDVGVNLPKSELGQDWAGLEAALRAEAGDPQLLLLADDGVDWSSFVHALNLGRQLGFSEAQMGAGAPR